MNQGFTETITRPTQQQLPNIQTTRRTSICPAVYKVGKRINTAKYIPSQLPNITNITNTNTKTTKVKSAKA